ncbi:hypothetical protein AS9A_3104 [Hoyosella subflava DQS3-9A1]|uniref:Uncharacterized protein n=1 Tax=Hoyosella subflava (strain DSM 45089 / JCM 17490 / NBRC 109087 / DQS3-9A1) TaxID=443218 RepID=F6ELV1_HOYSD|nr:hypothetical protein AS9A_3104 [Hoyosella subflava DQS3-9A1]
MRLTTDCADCTAELDHCHGTLIIHTGGSRECTSDECIAPARHRHVWVLDCDALQPDCSCATEDWLTKTG